MSSESPEVPFSLDQQSSLSAGETTIRGAKIYEPYNQYKREGWELTEEILVHRLGPIDHMDNTRYTGIYEGSRFPGFQEEFNLSAWINSEQTDGLVVNLVMKGIIHTQYHPLWMATQFAIIARQASQDDHVFFEKLGGITCPVSDRDYDWQLFFDPTKTGGMMNLARQVRTVNYLRQIRDSLQS